MKNVSHNDVVKSLKKKQDKVRDAHFKYVEHLETEAKKQVFIENAFIDWKSVPSAKVQGPLHDLEYMKVLALWRHFGVQGQSANVTVIDSGIDFEHPAFAHTEVIDESFVKGDPSTKDTNGHGTWVCGKIVGQGVGIAPLCNLTSYRTLDANGSGTSDASAAALKQVLADPTANLVNMSLGSPYRSTEQERFINELVKAGVIVVAAAGNYDTSVPFYPGSFESCLTVSATNSTQAKAYFSNYGGQIDIAAPGVACYSTYLNSQFRALSGTSMATPIVTGLLALGVSYLKIV